MPEDRSCAARSTIIAVCGRRPGKGKRSFKSACISYSALIIAVTLVQHIAVITRIKIDGYDVAVIIHVQNCRAFRRDLHILINFRAVETGVGNLFPSAIIIPCVSRLRRGRTSVDITAVLIDRIDRRADRAFQFKGFRKVILVFGRSLLPDDDTVLRSGIHCPFSVNRGVGRQFLIEVELAAVLLVDLSIAGRRRVLGIPSIESVSHTCRICRLGRFIANRYKLRFRIGSVGQILVKTEPVTALRIRLQQICGHIFQIDRITDLVKHHLAGDFRYKLLPAHELGDNAFFIRRIRDIALTDRVRRDSGIIGANKNNIGFDNDALLIDVVDGIRLEHHGVIGQLIQIMDAAILVQLSRDVNPYIRYGLGFCVSGIILYRCPAVEHGARR